MKDTPAQLNKIINRVAFYDDPVMRRDHAFGVGDRGEVKQGRLDGGPQNTYIAKEHI